MSADLSAGLIVAGVFALGLGLGGSFVWRDWRAAQTYRRALAAAVGGREDAARRIQGMRDGRPWQLRILQRRNRAAVIELVVPAQVRSTLAVHPRGLVDQAAVTMGLVQPIQTGDASFDAALIALGADDTPATRAAAARLLHADSRAALMRLQAVDMEAFVWSAPDQAVAMRWTSQHAADTDAARAAQFLALAAATSQPPGAAAATGTPGSVQAGTEGTGVLNAVVVALFMFGLGGFAAMALDATYPPRDRGPLLIGAAALAAGATAGWGWWTRRWRGRQPADHRAWLPMMLVAAVAFWLVAYAALVAINAAVDRA
jgi:hypothetical protein